MWRFLYRKAKVVTRRWEVEAGKERDHAKAKVLLQQKANGLLQLNDGTSSCGLYWSENFKEWINYAALLQIEVQGSIKKKFWHQIWEFIYKCKCGLLLLYPKNLKHLHLETEGNWWYISDVEVVISSVVFFRDITWSSVDFELILLFSISNNFLDVTCFSS